MIDCFQAQKADVASTDLLSQSGLGADLSSTLAVDYLKDFLERQIGMGCDRGDWRDYWRHSGGTHGVLFGGAN